MYYVDLTDTFIYLSTFRPVYEIASKFKRFILNHQRFVGVVIQFQILYQVLGNLTILLNIHYVLVVSGEARSRIHHILHR